MKQYEVRVTAQAENHMLEYAEYIQNELVNPQAAVKFIKDIQKAVSSLAQMPQRNPLTDEEPFAHGFRIFWHRNDGCRKKV